MEVNWQGIHIRFSLFRGSHIFVFGRYLSNGFWWIPKQDAGYRIIKGCVLVYRFAVTWHGLYGK